MLTQAVAPSVTAEPLVDVLIPVFNAVGTIRSSVESIQQQTFNDIRIIVVDDGSDDGTGEVLAELARDDPRIEILTISNSGIVDALNFGLSKCRAKYLARHDGDDIAYPNRFATQIAYLEANPDCVAVGAAARHIDDVGRDLHHVAALPPPSGANLSWAPMVEPYIIHPFLMVRLSNVQAVGGYRYAFHSEDTDLYWRLMETGRLHNLPDVLGDYRMHVGSISSRSIRNARVAALNSQLAGLSAIRRREKSPDLVFPRDALREYNGAEDLAAMFDVGRQQLTSIEAAYLRVRLAAKVLDLAAYRPIELDLTDCRFIRDALRAEMPKLTSKNRSVLKRMCKGAAARLASQNHLREAMTLLSPELYLGTLLRLSIRLVLPGNMKQRLSRQLGRSGHHK